MAKGVPKHGLKTGQKSSEKWLKNGLKSSQNIFKNGSK